MSAETIVLHHGYAFLVVSTGFGLSAGVLIDTVVENNCVCS